MKKIWNTFRYGKPDVKRVLLLALLAGLGTLGFLAAALLAGQLLFFFAALMCGFVTISLAQTFAIKEGENRQASAPAVAETESAEEEAPRRKRKKAKEEKLDSMKESERTAQDEGPLDSMKESKREKQDEGPLDSMKEPEQIEELPPDYADMDSALDTALEQTTADAERMFNEMEQLYEEMEQLYSEMEDMQEDEDEEESEDETESPRKKKKKKRVKKSKIKEKQEVEDEEVSANKSEKKKKTAEKQDKPVRAVPTPATEETFATYDKKKIKKTMHKYKVKRDHRMIMIDHSDKLQVKQTPAYMWVADKELHFLLIEEEPRHIRIPQYQFREVNYLKKQQVNEDVDYGAFKGKSILAELFRPYLPDYTKSTVVDDLSSYKNLYGLGNDIFVTNRSAAALFDLLAVEFRVDDKVTMSTKVNSFFKDAYKANIMLRDNVIDANGYADKISNVLNNLAHSTVSHAEFKDTLNLMIRNKLITQEFAMYYMSVRDNL